jgi:TolB-like protein/tetratricopeptide (TPR) repeat protein
MGQSVVARGRGSSAPSTNHRIAVLPLTNISADQKDEYFSDGMTEELISSLSRIAGLGVIARTSVMRFKGTTRPIAEIGKELGVGSVLEGSVRKSGNRVRITAQLVNASSEEQMWSQGYDRDLEDVFVIQSEIAQKIARSLKVRIFKDERHNLEKKPTEKPDAYSEYLKGRHSLNTRTEDSLKKAVEHFHQALQRDPEYSKAHSGLADAYAVMALLEFVPPKEAFPQARESAMKALEIDNGLAEAHASLGLVLFQYDWDWDGAEKEFKNAVGLNGNYAPAHQFFADYLKARGRFDEAFGEMGRAQALDPLSLAINTGVGHVLYLSRQYDRAIEQYGSVVKMDPSFVQARLWFGRPYLQKHMFKEAIGELEEAVKLSGNSTISLAMLGQAYAEAGKKGETRQILAKLMERSKKQYVPSYWIALLHVALGDKEEAFACLERAFQERSSWLVWANVEPRFDKLRSDKRFNSLLARMKLSPLKDKELGLRGWIKGPSK